MWGFGGGGGGWVGGSVRIVGWIGDLWGFKVLKAHKALGWVLRSLKLTEHRDDWVGRGLIDYRAVQWLGWKVLTAHRALGWVLRSLKLTKPWDGF